MCNGALSQGGPMEYTHRQRATRSWTGEPESEIWDLKCRLAKVVVASVGPRRWDTRGPRGRWSPHFRPPLRGHPRVRRCLAALGGFQGGILARRRRNSGMSLCLYGASKVAINLRPKLGWLNTDRAVSALMLRAAPDPISGSATQTGRTGTQPIWRRSR